MKKQLLSVLILAALLLTIIPTGHTQGPAAPPDPPEPFRACEIEGPCKAADGHWYMPEGARPHEANVMSPQETGGPDDYGYTWDDSVALNWIDATGGTDTGMSGSSSNQAVGPISLPFSFKYYENTYTSLYIAASGYLAFTEADYWTWQSRIPSPSTPNNVVAPYWTPLDLATGGPTNRVYYKSGGTAPNRYFVVEWYQVEFYYDDIYTFEVILYENGDIVFQYGTMSYSDGGACGDAGIENSAGLDGLSYVDFCEKAPSNKAVRIYRPAPSARASIRPLHQGHFVRAGEVASFEISIRNTGDLGADTYDVTISSTWPVSLYKADGTTPLSDTDGDGVADTGSVAQGASATIVAEVTTPQKVSAGDANQAMLTVQSSVDTGKSKTVSLQTGVPTTFAQVYRDDADWAMSLYLAQPGSQSLKKTTDDYYPGHEMAVAEMPDSFAYVWSKGRSVNNLYVREIEYTLLDSAGNTTRGVTRLTDHSGATVHTYDESPAVAVAPNGRIGVLWYRYRYNSSNGTINYNVFLAILDSAGNRVYGPLNLTNNNVWGDWDTYGVPYFYEPRIAATEDNRFVLAWQRHSQESAGYLYDIYYAVRDTNGNPVKGITKFTNGAAGDDYYYDPALARLSGNRALLAYSANSSISYGVLDSAGNVVKGETATGGYGHNPDAVQLADGSVLLAWTNWGADVNRINFAILGGANYNVVAGPTALDNPAAVTGDDYVSVTADGAGRGVLTWMDYDYSYRRNLYYALVDSSGAVLTDPMIFRTSQATEPHIETSYEGYGNTSYSDLTPPTSQAESPEFALGPFPVTWSGSDEGFGIAGYDVQVRDGADGTWTDWLTGTTALSATYTAVESGHTYYFRSLAYDQAGNVETDLPADGDTHTTVAEYKVEGRVTNNRGQPVFNATVSAAPEALNTATTDPAGDYALYFESGGTYTLTASRSGFGALPPMHDLSVNGHLSGVDFVLPPEDEAVTNGGGESGDLSGWNSGPGMTPTVEMTAAHTGRYGLDLQAGGGTLAFWPYVTQTVSIPSTWAQPTLSFLYRAIQGETGDALQAVIVGTSKQVTHTVALSPGAWTHAWRDLSDFAGQTVTIQFGFQEQTAGQQVYLDEVSVGESKTGVLSVYLPLVLRGH